MAIKSLGGVALLVSGLTGPSVAIIPLLYEQAGWLTPLITFVVTTILTGSAALFLVEAMASIAGNESFQASIEFSTIAALFLGRRWHWAIQIILYITLQSQTITSLIESFQTMDALLVTIAHKSCAISFQKGWECVDSILPDGSGVFSDYIFVSFGYLITLIVVLPLGLIQLSDNIKFQIASFITLFFIAIVWVATFFQVGITNNSIPVVGHNQGTLVGYVISNFAFVTTIPAFVNNVHPSTHIRRVIWLSLVISCTLYITFGWAGASAFKVPENSTILNIIASRRPSTIALISTYLFTPAVLITSIPVFMIVIRYNLLRGNICSKPWAIFWSSILPWIIVIPFQTNGWIAIILNWTSLIFSSAANLIIPFLLYLASKRYHASAVLDIQREHDEFRLSPLEPLNLEASMPLSPRPRSHSPSRLRTSLSAEQSPTAIDAADVPTSNIIRRIRSPSIHRHYGQQAEGSNIPRRQSVSKLSTIDDEKTLLNIPSDDITMEVDTSKKSASLTADDLISTFPHRNRSSYVRDVEVAADVISERDCSDAANDAQSTGTSSRPISPPVIKIETPMPMQPSLEHNLSADGDSIQSPLRNSHLSHTSGHEFGSPVEQLGPWSASESIDSVRPSPVSQVMGYLSRRHTHSSSHGGTDGLLHTPTIRGEGGNSGDATSTETPLPGGIPEQLELLAARGISLTISSPVDSNSPDETPRRKFEAFPYLNRTRWFNSTIYVAGSCVLATIMVLGTVIYDIVQAVHNGGQTPSP